jgi:predicted nucleotidyltransferase
LATIIAIIQKYPYVRLVHLFGSRAKGNYRPGSDIDLAIMNEGLDPKTMMRMAEDFSESSLPYKVDVVHFETLQHEAFKDHIQRVGIGIYEKK